MARNTLENVVLEYQNCSYRALQLVCCADQLRMAGIRSYMYKVLTQTDPMESVGVCYSLTSRGENINIALCMLSGH